MDELSSIISPTILDLAGVNVGTAFNRARNDFKYLQLLCEKYGIHTGMVKRRDTLLLMLKKWCRQSNVYEGFDTQQLAGFVLARRLDSDGCAGKIAEAAERIMAPSKPCEIKSETTLHRSTRNKIKPKPEENSSDTTEDTKASLIKKLEAADREIRLDFLGLPREIRDMVYSLVCQGSSTRLHIKGLLPIARACRQTREEALPLYYRSNRFALFVDQAEASWTSTSNHWLNTTNPDHLRLIRSFAFVVLTNQLVVDMDLPSQRQHSLIGSTRNLNANGRGAGLSRSEYRRRHFMSPESYKAYWIHIFKKTPLVLDRFAQDTLLHQPLPAAKVSSNLNANLLEVIASGTEKAASSSGIGKTVSSIAGAEDSSLTWKMLSWTDRYVLRNLDEEDRDALLESRGLSGWKMSWDGSATNRMLRNLNAGDWSTLREEWDAAQGLSARSLEALIAAMDDQVPRP